MPDGQQMPVVKLEMDLNRMARRLGEVAPRLDLFDLNGKVVYFDHRGRQLEMTGRRFRTWINEHVVIAVKYNADDGAPIPGTLKSDDAASIIEAASFLCGLRSLDGVNRVRLPVIRKSGQLELLPEGYDSETRHYTVTGGPDFDLDMDLDAAKGWFSRILRDFPFANERSMAVQIASMLSLFVKHLPGGTGLRPGFLWLANKPGSGKSVLAKMGLYAVIGKAAAAKMKRGSDLDKELEAFCLSAVPYIFLDNVYGGLQSAAIDQLLTSKQSTGRAMGGHGTFEANNTALVLVTGNQLQLNDDAARRFLVIDLFEKGDPRKREIGMPMDDDVMEREDWRMKTLAALWALVRHWHEKGMPKAEVTMPTFEQYAEMLGGIVAAAGYGEPFEEPDIPDAISPEKQEFAEFIAALVEDMDTTDWEADGREMRGVLKKQYTKEELAVIARAKGVFAEKIGTKEDGKRLTIKKDGLTGEDRRLAEDFGYMDRNEGIKFGLLLKKHMGSEHYVGGRKVEFGKRRESMKRVFTITLE